MRAVSAGRSTPGSSPSTILAVTIAAPVLPAVTKPATFFSRTSFRPTRIELSFLVRTACAAFSSMPIRLRGVMDDDRQVFVFEMLVQQIAELAFRPNQMHPHRKRAAGFNGAANLRFRSFV